MGGIKQGSQTRVHNRAWRQMERTPEPGSNAQTQRLVIVGGGPVGLSLALDLGRRGHQVVVLNRLDYVATGSKAICFAKRTLDIWDRLGVGAAIVEKGLEWNVGKVFWGAGDEPIYRFDMQPVKNQKMPGFVNLQQYHVEDALIAALAECPHVEIRWGHEVVGVAQDGKGCTLSVETHDATYSINAEWVVACDGSRSPVRELLGLDFEGRVFEDNFLIADIRMKQPLPTERWFWFDPPFNPGNSALLHKQPDDVWRLDFQLGWNIDREACVRPENVEPFIRGMLGDAVEFEQEWYSVYTFQCRRMQHFVHDRVLFAGDSAHLVSPFGARGCNGGIADIDNLAWKLDLVLRDAAPASLIDTYDHEAIVTADENILNSSRSTDFMTPKSAVSRAFRDAVLELARDHAFARPFVNSGRLSTAVSYPDSPLNTPDQPGETWAGIAPGSPALDAPAADGWLLDHINHGGFTLLSAGPVADVPAGMHHRVIDVDAECDRLAVARYDLQPGSAYLLRPDSYVAARWRHPDFAAIEAAHDRARGLS